MGNVSVFEVLWEWIREIEGKEEVLIWHFTSKSEDLLLFFGEDMGRRKKGRGPCKSESYKVLKLIFIRLFYCLSKNYNLQSNKKFFARIKSTIQFRLSPGAFLYSHRVPD